MKIASFIIALILTVHIQAQITGVIVNVNTGEALPYVNIGVVGTTYGTVSDLNGAFELYLPQDISDSYSIRSSSIGFISYTLTVADARRKLPLQIELMPTSLTLPEVLVKPGFKNFDTQGNINADAKMVTNLAIQNRPNQNLGSEIGRKFHTRKPAYLQTFRFYITRNNFDTIRFRVNVYDLNGGKPGVNILHENIIMEINNRKTGWVEVDLSAYQIQVEKAFAVSAEWVYASSKGSQLGFPVTIPAVGATHFYKYGSQNKWKKFPQMSACMEVTLAW